MPQTLLARTFLLLALLVLLTTAAWLSLFRHIEAEPRARETAQLAASAVNLIRASLFAASPEKRPALFAEGSAVEKQLDLVAVGVHEHRNPFALVPVPVRQNMRDVGAGAPMAFV